MVATSAEGSVTPTEIGMDAGQALVALLPGEMIEEVLAGGEDAGVGSTVKVSALALASGEDEALAGAMALELELEGHMLDKMLELEVVPTAAT